MGWFWSGLERGLNATLAWPQQMFMRGLRVIQDEDVGFFDEEGFADWAALPILGAFDDDPKYVSGRETFDRTAGRLGIKHNMATEFAANLLTDPTFFMTGGLTATAKTARSIENARRTWAVTKRVGLKVDQDMPIGEIKKVMQEALTDPLTKRADRRRIQTALRRIGRGEIHEGSSLRDLLVNEGKRELRLSLPLMNHYGMGIRVAPGYESWFKLASDKMLAPANKAMAHAAGGTVGRLPFVRQAFDNSAGLLGDFKRGFASRGQEVFRHDLPVLQPRDTAKFTGMFTGTNRTLYKRVFNGSSPLTDRLSRYAKTLTKTGDPLAAANKAFGTRLGRHVLEMVGKTDATAQDILTTLTDWKGQYEGAVNSWHAVSKPTTELTEVGKAMEAARKKGKLALAAFTAGRRTGSEAVKTFTSDIGIKGFREAEAKFHSASANYQRYIEEVTRTVLAPTMMSWAKASGLTPQQAERVTAHIAQMTALPEELAHHMELGRAQGISERNADSLLHFSARFARSAELLQRTVQGGGNSDALRRLADQLVEGVKTDLDDKAIRGLFEGAAADIRLDPQDVAKFLDQADPASHYVLATGPKGLRGRHLQFAPDNALRERLAVIERATARAAKKGEAALTSEKAAELRMMEADRKAIVEVLERRGSAARGSKYLRMPPSVKRITVPRPERDLRRTTLHAKATDDETGKAIIGDALEDGEVLRSVIELRSLGREMKRVAQAAKKGADVELSPERYAAALGAVERLSGRIEEIVFKGTPEGEQYLKSIREVRRQILSDAMEIGAMRSGSPIGYLPFVRSSDEHRILRELFDQDELFKIVDTAMPTLGAMMRRRADEVTLEDLNDLYRILKETQSPAVESYVKTLEGVGQSLGLKLQAYEDTPTLVLMNRLAQGRRAVTSRDFVQSLIDEGGGRVVGARVKAYVVAGQENPIASLRTYRAEVSKGTTIDEFVEERDIVRPDVEAIVLETPEGDIIVGADRLTQNGALLPLGSPDLGLLNEHERAASAFSHRAARGELDATALIEGDSVLRDMKRLAALEGQYVMLADKDVLAGTLSAVNNQFKHFHKAVRAYDAVAFSMKRWATVFRLPFHILNAGGTIAQAHTVGIGVRNTMGGMTDMARFLHGSAQVAERYDAFAAATAVGKERAGWKRMSAEFLSVIRRNPELKDALKGMSTEDALDAGLVWRNGEGSYYTVGEIMEALRPVFATSVREGLRGGARVSQTMMEIYKSGTLGGFREALQRAATARDNVLEASEIASRLTIFFGGLRQGRSLDDAARSTMLASVDYAGLTTRERDYFKRFFGFYTFARKFFPVAYDRFATDPQYAATLSKIMTQEGMLRDQNGELVLNVGENKALPVQRLAPQMDALRMAEVLVERFGKVAAPQVAREQRLEGEARQPFTPGPLPQILNKAVFEGDPAGALEDGRDLIWPLRVIFDPGDPFEEPTMLERFYESVSPLKERHKERSRVFLRGRLRDVINDLERKMETTTDPEDRQVLRAEVRRLTARYRAMDKELK